MSSAFKLPPPIYDTVHRLRETREGIQHLKNTDRYQDYMERRLSRGPSHARNAANNRAYRARNAVERPFIMWDGEGWSDTDGHHRYMLFGASTGEHIEYPRLTTLGCLELILRVGAEHKDSKPIHVIYGGGYDVTHILRDMPTENRTELLESGNTSWLVVTGSVSKVWERFVFEYRPHKWFTVTGTDWATGKRVTVKIYDVMTFFQSSFIKALESRGIEVSDEIRSGKAARSDFTFADMDEIKVYWQQELEYGVELCNQLRDEFKEAGLAVTQYYGPGAVANTTLRHYGVKRFMKRPTDEIEVAAAHAYFGGRFETFKVGHHEGKVYQADINSAYPHAIRSLPDLSNAEWVWTTDYDGSPGMWFCRYDSGNTYLPPHPLPWRGRGGVIGFPGQIDGGVWLWHYEAKYASEVLYGWKLVTDWSVKPFAFVEGMFTLRKEWKALGRGGERALKLAMNSLYGKLAQRIGGKDGKPPTWHQLEWAGMITSATRAMMWEAVKQDPESVIAVETDSVTTTSKLDLPYGDGLGEWDYEEYDWITYLQSGIYYTSGGSSNGKSKTRGVDLKELPHSLVMAYLAGDRLEPLLVKSRNFIALSNPASTWAYGQWTDGVKELTISDGKRIHVPDSCSACQAGLRMSDTLHDLIAMPVYGVAPSIPHELPWRGDVVESDNEMQRTDMVAIEEWQ